MSDALWGLLGLSLIKLSMDDLERHAVYTVDLGVLSLLALCLFKPKPLDTWILMGLMVVSLACLGKLRESLGSADLTVIVVMGIIMEFNAFLLALQLSSLFALIAFWIKKKAVRDEVPFVPFLSMGILTLYLIRLRFIFS